MLDFILNCIIVIFAVILITRLVYYFVIRKLIKPYSLSECEFNKWLDKKYKKIKKRKDK